MSAAPILFAASALGIGLWWFWPAQKTGVAPIGDKTGGDGKVKTPPTAAETAAAKLKGTADGCARGTADGKGGKSAAQAAADLNVGGKDHDAWLAAGEASGDSGVYFEAYAIAHSACFEATTKTKAMPLPTTYKVGAGETPASIASKYGITVDALLSGLNGYGHGESGSKDNAPYPYGGELHAFTSTFPAFAGVTFSPTWQAGHKATANLRPIFRSSKSIGGQWYWWFPAGASPSAVPGAYAPNDSGFGRIYSDGGLFLVGPWYVGMSLIVPGKAAGVAARRRPVDHGMDVPGGGIRRQSDYDEGHVAGHAACAQAEPVGRVEIPIWIMGRSAEWNRGYRDGMGSCVRLSRQGVGASRRRPMDPNERAHRAGMDRGIVLTDVEPFGGSHIEEGTVPVDPFIGSQYNKPSGRALPSQQFAFGPRIGNLAIVGARRAPVEVDHMHAGMGGHFTARPSSRHGWPAPPDDDGDDGDDGTSTLYRSY